MGCGSSQPSRRAGDYSENHARPADYPSTLKYPSVSTYPSPGRGGHGADTLSAPHSSYSPSTQRTYYSSPVELHATPSFPSLSPSTNRFSPPPPSAFNAYSSPPPHSQPQTSPPCRVCGCPSQRSICASPNKNGNAGRPQYLCTSPGCGEFVCFDDHRGVHPNNPSCRCGAPARMILMANRQFFYRCASGHCDFRRNGGDSGMGLGPISSAQAMDAGF